MTDAQAVFPTARVLEARADPMGRTIAAVLEHAAEQQEDL